jgi:hypothetical protein
VVSPKRRGVVERGCQIAMALGKVDHQRPVLVVPVRVADPSVQQEIAPKDVGGRLDASGGRPVQWEC